MHREFNAYASTYSYDLYDLLVPKALFLRGSEGGGGGSSVIAKLLILSMFFLSSKYVQHLAT